MEPISIIGGLFLLAAFLLSMITIAAIIDVAEEHLDGAKEIIAVDPQYNKTLDEYWQSRKTANHARIVYDGKTKKGVLVQSNKVAYELAGQEKVTIEVT